MKKFELKFRKRMDPNSTKGFPEAGPTLAFAELVSIILISSCFAIILVKLLEMLYLRTRAYFRRNRGPLVEGAVQVADPSVKRLRFGTRKAEKAKLDLITKVSVQTQMTEYNPEI